MDCATIFPFPPLLALFLEGIASPFTSCLVFVCNGRGPVLFLLRTICWVTGPARHPRGRLSRSSVSGSFGVWSSDPLRDRLPLVLYFPPSVWREVFTRPVSSVFDVSGGLLLLFRLTWCGNSLATYSCSLLSPFLYDRVCFFPVPFFDFFICHHLVRKGDDRFPLSLSI